MFRYFPQYSKICFIHKGLVKVSQREVTYPFFIKVTKYINIAKGKNILIFVSHISDKGLIYKKYKELIHACMQIMSLQSCLTLFDPMDRRLPDSSVHETPQARILEWVAFPSPGDLPNPGIKLEISCTVRRILYL